MGIQSDAKSLCAASGNVADENYRIRDQPPPETDEHGYRIKEQPMGTKRKVKVILMGAGASSLNFFKKAEQEMEKMDMVCYEKNSDVGGIWLENRYPGCACDIPSVNYQFTWKIKLWSHYYSYSPEIWEYLKSIERENDFIEKYIKLRHRIERLEWDSDAGLWRCTVRNLVTDEVFEDSAEFFINAGGVLNNWKWLEIPGLHDFRGKLMHSANYEEGYDLTNKPVAVIGAGSSGVQIVAAIQQKVDHLYHWIRSPIWITAGFAQTWAGKDGANFQCANSKEQLKFLEENPEKYLEYRKQIENELNQRFKFILKGSDEARAARSYADSEMRAKLNNDPVLVEKMIPKNFNPGCRRPTPAPGYLEALVASNTTIFTDPIGSITPTGFTDHEGNSHSVDVIICATGFNTTWLPRFPFVANGVDLRDMWKESVTSYLSVGIPNFPNTFSFCSPYGPLGHSSFMPLIEPWTRYIFHAITKSQIENIKSLTPKLAPSLAFRQHADLFLQRTAWTSPCRSWFKQGQVDGQAAIWPGSRFHFLNMLETPRYEDFEIEYHEGNIFAFLGNGFEARESDGRDITNYLGCLSDEGRDVQPDYDEGLIEILGGTRLGDGYVGKGD